MAKDRRKKKYLQGMEHLKPVVPPQFQDNEAQDSRQKNGNVDIALDNSDTMEHVVLKKELITVLIIMTFLFLALVVLMYIDRTNTILLELAEKITSFFVK